MSIRTHIFSSLSWSLVNKLFKGLNWTVSCKINTRHFKILVYKKGNCPWTRDSIKKAPWPTFGLRWETLPSKVLVQDVAMTHSGFCSKSVIRNCLNTWRLQVSLHTMFEAPQLFLQTGKPSSWPDVHDPMVSPPVVCTTHYSATLDIMVIFGISLICPNFLHSNLIDIPSM